MAQANTKETGYLPTLDGWRGIAILTVILCHAYAPFERAFADRGVDVFFGISGLLICTRLLDEERLAGKISLRRFYVRRIFRLMPAALTYLTVIGVLEWSGVLAPLFRQLIASLLFFRNYTSLAGIKDVGPSWYTGHFWSLSIEEQFYLFLPSFLVITPPRYRKVILIALALAIALNRYHQLTVRPWDLIQRHTDVRIDSLLMPALIAIYLHRTSIRDMNRTWLRPWPIYVLVVIGIYFLMPSSAVQRTLLVIAIPIVLAGAVAFPVNLFGRLLESSPLKFIGKISYSLYLWQQLFLPRLYSLPHPLGILDQPPVCFIMIVVCAIASYYLIERPFIRFGHRLTAAS